MQHKELTKLEWHDRFTYKKNIVFNETDLACKGTKFQIVKFESGTTIKKHYHLKTREIFFILEGKGILTINKESIPLQKGVMVLCEPKDRHAFENNSKKELIILIFKTNETKKDMYWE